MYIELLEELISKRDVYNMILRIISLELSVNDAESDAREIFNYKRRGLCVIVIIYFNAQLESAATTLRKLYT